MLEEWRRRIDEIDEQIVKLLGERTRLALQIGREKRSRDLPLRSPERELEVLARVTQAGNYTPLSTEAILKIYRTILEETHRLQEKDARRPHPAGGTDAEAGADETSPRGA